MITNIRKKLAQALFVLCSAVLLFSCQKNIDDTIVNPPTNNADLTTKVTSSSVSGFVTDENNAAVQGASVKVGISTTSTDEYGYFEINNVEVIKNAATVTVSKAGYFKGIKTFIATAGKGAFFRIKLIPNNPAGTIDAATGGNVTLTNGMIVALPANGVVNASTNAAYTGIVNVAVSWINPTAADLYSIMPGDLRALNTAGALQQLKTFGMAAVELTGSAGELLQIATGKKATLTFPLPTALAGTAPASIPLWSFDETLGLWKEEGSATKTGNTYVGEVSHFSFWNCDVPNDYVQFSCTVVNANGDPIPYTLVKISEVSDPWNYAYGITDTSGFVSGAIPDNAQLKLEVFTSFSCGNAIHSQNFTSANVNIALGNITVPNSTTSTANVSGTVTNCNNLPLADGYILVLNDNQYSRYALSSTGSFDFPMLLCNGPAVVTVIAEDIASGQQSNPTTFTIAPGANALGNIQACGVTTDQFLTYTIDGGATISYTAPADSLTLYATSGTVTNVVLSAYSTPNTNFANINMDFTGIALNSQQPLINFSHNQNGMVPTSPISVNITEYGAIGQFISGNFTGTLTTQSTPSTNHTVTCSFRVRRIF